MHKKISMIILMGMIVCGVLFLMTACAKQGNTEQPQQETAMENTLSVSGDGINGQVDYDLSQLLALPDAQAEHIYSVINNWPTKKNYAAKGIKVSAVLQAVGAWDSFQTVTFKSPDGYEMVLTRDQLLDSQYYYPNLENDDTDGATLVEPIIAYEYLEDSTDLTEVAPDSFCFILGQRNVFEHNNPAFVKNLSQIIISNEDPGAWEVASTYPTAGKISATEKVKLEHDSFGMVKIFYTVDGTDPTTESTMYNPSTYQPELNTPIVLEKDTIIKVLVSGYGKKDSSIETYQFEVQ
ncbi:MAG: FN3 associated domain-containing protein [Bacillota bacterium]|jgi:hypothetical protein